MNRESRRIFMGRASVLSILSMGLGTSLLKSSPITDWNQGLREALEEPGPMLPPVPAILLTVDGLEGGPDEISVVWTFVVNGHPPQIGISVGDEHLARNLIVKHGQFVLNVPVASIVEAFDLVDMNSTRKADKFELSGLHRMRAHSIDAPAIVESPIHVECKVFNEVRVPPARTIFLADVIATTVLPGVCTNGRLNVENVDFFGMTSGSGEFYTMGTKVGNIGKSVGRSDIKY